MPTKEKADTREKRGVIKDVVRREGKRLKFGLEKN